MKLAYFSKSTFKNAGFINPCSLKREKESYTKFQDRSWGILIWLLFAIEPQVSLVVTPYTVHMFFRQRFPEVGKLSHDAARLLSVKSQPVPIP